MRVAQTVSTQAMEGTTNQLLATLKRYFETLKDPRIREIVLSLVNTITILPYVRSSVELSTSLRLLSLVEAKGLVERVF